ncbi:MAG: DUF4271 domain-containing protein [Rikenellaceae bacterium]
MGSAEQLIDNIPQYIFGQHSFLSHQSQVVTSTPQDSFGRLLAALLALTLAVIYLAWVNHWSAHGGGNHYKIFRFLGYHRGNYNSKLELITPSFKTYIRTGNGLFVVTIWLLSLSMIEYFGGGNSITISSRWSLYIGAIIAIVVTYFFQMIIIVAIGWVMRSKSFATTMLYVKGILFNIAAITITPTALCFNLSRNTMQDIMLYIIAAQIAAAIIILLYESFFLFLEKKVSVLHTILYLCAVEVFPMTLVWGVLYR